MRETGTALGRVRLKESEKVKRESGRKCVVEEKEESESGTSCPLEPRTKTGRGTEGEKERQREA